MKKKYPATPKDKKDWIAFTKHLEDVYDKNNVNDLNIILQTDEIPQNYITVSDEKRSSNGLEKGVIGSALDREKNERIYISSNKFDNR